MELSANVVKWLINIFRPIAAIQTAVKKVHEEGVPSLFSDLWLVPLLATIALDSTVTIIYGAHLESNSGFVLLYMLCTTIKILLDAFLLFLVMKLLLKMPVKANEVIACYTPYAIYAPLAAALNWPQAIHFYNLIKLVKQKMATSPLTLQYFFENLDKFKVPDSISNVWLRDIDQWASQSLALLTIITVSEGITQICNVDRFKAYFGVSLSGLISVVVDAPFGSAQLALIGLSMK